MISARNLIVVWHGSTRQAWVDVARLAVEHLESRLDLSVRTASVGTFQERLQDALSEGAVDIVVLPLFVAPGGHVFDDVDAAIVAAKDAHPGVSISRLATMLETSEVLDALVSVVKRA